MANRWAQAQPYATSAIPYIGENGNWWVNREDTGVKAQGPQGEKGARGEAGIGAPGPAFQYEDLTEEQKQELGSHYTAEIRELKDAAAANAEAAAANMNESLTYYKQARSYATGDVGVRPDEGTDNAKHYYEQVKRIAQSVGGVVPMGTIAFAELPTENITANAMYNISDAFVSDERFIDGGGKYYGVGSNVYYTASGLWDVLAANAVTGIKGEADDTFSQGNVTITTKSLGLDEQLRDTVPYNLIPFPYSKGSHTDNGIEWTVNEDGSVTANGTPTTNAYFALNILALDSGTYTYSVNNSNGILGVDKQLVSDKSHIGSYVDNTYEKATFTINESDIGVYCLKPFLCVLAGQTAENLTFKPMLVKGDTTKEFRKNFKSVYEMQQYLTGTLTAGETTLTIFDSSITEDSMIDIYTDVYGVNPTEVTVANGSITLIFDAQETDLSVKVRVM